MPDGIMNALSMPAGLPNPFANVQTPNPQAPTHQFQGFTPQFQGSPFTPNPNAVHRPGKDGPHDPRLGFELHSGLPPMFGPHFQRMNALAPGNTGVVPPNVPGSQMPVAQPGGGMTGAPLQGNPVSQMPFGGVGSSYGIPGMTMPNNPYGLPTY